MVYVVKCFIKIYKAQVDCVTSFNKAVDYMADSMNCVTATHHFLKPHCYISRES